MSDPITPELTTPLVTHAMALNEVRVRHLMHTDFMSDEEGEYDHRGVSALMGHMPIPNLVVRTLPSGVFIPIGKFSRDLVYSLKHYFDHAGASEFGDQRERLLSAKLNVIMLDSDRAVNYYLTFNFV